MATLAHKRNSNVSLADDEGNYILDHEQKANLLWTAYKDIMGVSDSIGNSYNLSELITSHDLSHLDTNFKRN
jgi:hypothetical protein